MKKKQNCRRIKKKGWGGNKGQNWGGAFLSKGVVEINGIWFLLQSPEGRLRVGLPKITEAKAKGGPGNVVILVHLAD